MYGLFGNSTLVGDRMGDQGDGGVSIVVANSANLTTYNMLGRPTGVKRRLDYYLLVFQGQKSAYR
jgi:hypothetical protein